MERLRLSRNHLGIFVGTAALAAYWGLGRPSHAAPAVPVGRFFPLGVQDLRLGDVAPALPLAAGGPDRGKTLAPDGRPVALLLAGPCARCSAPTFALWDDLYREYGGRARVLIVSTSSRPQGL